MALNTHAYRPGNTCASATGGGRRSDNLYAMIVSVRHPAKICRLVKPCGALSRKADASHRGEALRPDVYVCNQTAARPPRVAVRAVCLHLPGLGQAEESNPRTPSTRFSFAGHSLAEDSHSRSSENPSLSAILATGKDHAGWAVELIGSPLPAEAIGQRGSCRAWEMHR